MEDYQQNVDQMQRLMEETKMVSECKIRQLHTENEALRNHLKLALDSLRNPIPPVTIEKRKSSLYALEEESRSPEFTDDREDDSDMSPASPSFSDIEPEPDLIWEDDDTIQIEASQVKAQDMQSHMEDLLSDLTMFKRKLASDHERFRSIRTHQNRKQRRALRDVLIN